MKSLGMMSGTSIDGSVSAAIIETDGEDRVSRIATHEHVYEADTTLRPIHHLLKAAEVAYRKAAGDHRLAAEYYPSAMREYLAEVVGVAQSSVDATLRDILHAFSPGSSAVSLAEVVSRSTNVHIAAARAIIEQTGISPKEINYIGYHGQTLYHDPFFNRITVQVGEPQLLANELGIPVVYDFRTNDVALGGQGAPLAPAYHRALLRSGGMSNAAVLNLGGTANLTVTSASSDQMLGFDTGPANGLIDRYVKEKLGIALDKDSKLAHKGTVSERALQRLLKDAIVLKDGRNFLDITPPKSLDIRDYTYAFPEFEALSIEDGCATLNAFTAECVARGVDWIRHLGFEVPTRWVTCGGGVFSPHLQAQLLERLTTRIPGGVSITSADSVGWSAQGMEAELFAYLAVRSVRHLPITFPGTTGVKQPATGGRLVMPLVQ
jgi:anhydro-N-acetylmuramic acid kinase